MSTLLNYDVGVFIGRKCPEKADWYSLKIRGREMEHLSRWRAETAVAHLSGCVFKLRKKHVRGH